VITNVGGQSALIPANFTADVPIRRHLYAQTMRKRPPFVLGYDVVGQIDQLCDGVSGFQLGDQVADMTVLGSNASCPL
jgi:NADPH:quinone reductase-like Zn-dependent oxidoreductase